VQPELPGRPCSIARALDVVGEKWALLAIREISFGNRRFNEIARNTGAPRDRLAARLHSLVEAGILERREYQSAPPRAGYHLTAAGRDLAPVLHALVAWGDRWVSDEPPATLMHGDHELDPVQACRHCGAEASAALSVRVNSPGWDLRGPVPAAELARTTLVRTGPELATVVGAAFEAVSPPRRHSTLRTPPGRGQWSQWEAIWVRRPGAGAGEGVS
jgi:DNA-binding HxlR family transcriptional regulator